jgi:16S rRNA (cytosine1402-N4)-methyltransferase
MTDACGNASLLCDEENVPQFNGHEPVLLEEVLGFLRPAPGQTIVDATLGLGGHSEALLAAVAPDGLVIGIDRDLVAIERATRRLERFGGAFLPVRGNHRDVRELVQSSGVDSVDGILFDLGVSSMQLGEAERGFSFAADGPLDMRMDPSSGRTAADLLADLTEQELSRILWRYGEERRARAIARAVVAKRVATPFRTTLQLADLVREVSGPAASRYRIHPATRTFQALRIAVNGEIDDLQQTIEDAERLLRPGGRIVVIAFHSLEDRCAKRTLRGLASRCLCPPALPVCGCGREDRLRMLTGRVVRPTADEAARNPRSRSARLRAAEKI